MANFLKTPLTLKIVAIGAGAACGSMMAGAQSADAAAITLGSASTYGTLVGTGQTLKITGGFNLTGDLGVGASSTFNKSGSNTITGNYYKDSGITGSSSGTTTITGSTITQSMTTAINDALTASTAASAATDTVGLQNQGGSISLNNSSLTIKALGNLSENVLSISALSLTNGTLTFDDNGYTGAKFIVNVSGNFTLSSSVIKGINGASAADIIFNIEGTGTTVSLTGGTTSTIGTILAPSRNVTIGGGGTLTGSLIAGVNNLSKSYTLQTSSGGYNITDFAYKPVTVTKSPEPSSMAILGAGLTALAYVRRRRAERAERQ